MTHSDVAAVAEVSGVRTGKHANTRLVVLFLSLAGLSYAIMQSLVAPALPLIGTDLGVSSSDISWVLTAFLLSASVLTPILSRLGDMVGKRRILLVVLVILAVGTLVCALAPNLLVLVIGRAIQGASGAILPLSVGVVRDELPREKVGVTVGLLSALFGVGGGLGVVLAGPIADNLSWEWLFWLPLVVILVALVGVAVGVPESPVRSPGRIDVGGATILSVALVSTLLAVSKGSEWGWGSTRTMSLLTLGLVALVVFVVVELRMSEPLIDVRLVATRAVGCTNLVGLTFGFAMFGIFVLFPTILELPASTGYGFGLSVSQAGLFLLPTTMMMLVAGPLSGQLDRRYGPKVPMVMGTVTLVVAFALPAIAHDQHWQLIVSGLLMGAGIGLAFAAMSNAIIESVPQTETAAAMSVNTIVRTIGGSMGAAVLASVMASHATADGVPTDQAFTIGFWVCCAAAILAVAAALALPSPRRLRAAALAVGVEDLPAEPVELHAPHLHLHHHDDR